MKIFMAAICIPVIVKGALGLYKAIQSKNNKAIIGSSVLLTSVLVVSVLTFLAYKYIVS